MLFRVGMLLSVSPETGRLHRPDGDVLYTDDRPLTVIARNVSMTYLAIIADIIIGVVTLPLNVTHLGTSAYGLWMLASSVTVHFSLLDLGYGGALIKFTAHYRARRDPRALNEIASTLFFVFATLGCIAYAIAALIAFHLDSFFRITPEQARVGRWVLLVISTHVALNFPFSVFGGIVNGFQRQHVNGIVAITTSTLAGIVNVAVLYAGYGLVPLVCATTTVRVLAYFVYAANAYRIFPALRVTPALVRWTRLREVTGFSIYASLIDWSYKLNYQLDQLVIGAFLGASPVAIWSVADRIITATQMLTNQLNGVLFPVVVDSDSSKQSERLRQILLQGTRLSLAAVLPIATALVVIGGSLIRAWVGTRKPELLGSVPVLQILAVAVAIRVGNGTATTVLKGAGRHRFLACVNLTTGFANLALSVLFVHFWGLPGVALGTLVPVAFSAIFIVQPAASRRVGLTLRATVVEAVLPALWPAFVIGLALAATRSLSAATLAGLAAQMVIAVPLYIVLFLVAIGPRDRNLYLAKVSDLLGRRLALAAPEAS